MFDPEVYFARFSSNTIAGGANQSWFDPGDDAPHTGRVFYRLSAGGKYNYSFLYSNVMDSTYADGSHSHANMICGAWELLGLTCAVCKRDVAKDAPVIAGMTPVLFDGKTARHVAPGEFFCSDPLELEAEAGDYLCLEITFSGRCVPYLEETILPVFHVADGAVEKGRRFPVPGMIGCDRPVKQKIVFLGDSITEGLGTPEDQYLFWTAKIAEQLGTENSFWNLGIGYGRCADAAGGGSWIWKASHGDFVNVCFGVNDMLHGDRGRVRENLTRIVTMLKKAGCRVGLFTVPPFEWVDPDLRAIWEEGDRYIKEELGPQAEYVLDTADIWGQPGELRYHCAYGGHPNPEGCAKMADAYCAMVREKQIF